MKTAIARLLSRLFPLRPVELRRPTRHVPEPAVMVRWEWPAATWLQMKLRERR